MDTVCSTMEKDAEVLFKIFVNPAQNASVFHLTGRPPADNCSDL